MDGKSLEQLRTTGSSLNTLEKTLTTVFIITQWKLKYRLSMPCRVVDLEMAVIWHLDFSTTRQTYNSSPALQEVDI